MLRYRYSLRYRFSKKSFQKKCRRLYMRFYRQHPFHIVNHKTKRSRRLRRLVRRYSKPANFRLRSLVLRKLLFKRYVKYYFRQILLQTYRQRIYLRFQSNNLFLTTNLPKLDVHQGYNLTAGLLADYKKKKKKKKSYTLGFELMYLFTRKLEDYKVRNLYLYLKGRGAQRKGVHDVLKKFNFKTLMLVNTTPVAHNGTKKPGKRRL